MVVQWLDVASGRPCSLICLFQILFLVFSSFVWSGKRPIIVVSTRKMISGSKSSRFVQSKNAVAVFVQARKGLGHLEDIIDCTANVAKATERNRIVDVYISINEEDMNDQRFLDATTSLKQMEFIDNVFSSAQLRDSTGDLFEFFHQVQQANQKQWAAAYEIALKLPTLADNMLQQRAVESLCGTPEQVQSIWNGVNEARYPVLVSPMGTSMGPDTRIDDVFPHLVKNNYFNKSSGPLTDHERVGSLLNYFYELSGDVGGPKVKRNLWKVAGNAFWISWDGLPQVNKLWPKERRENAQKELKFISSASETADMLLPSYISMMGGTILEMQPAPKVFATYFPQYHQVFENDQFWGENFTEWTILRNLTMDPPLKKPLSIQEGGLGYYNLEDRDTRRKQGEMARKFGLQGFVYYHYWFSGEKAPNHHKVMAKVIEAMLLDGQPDVSFMLSWANEPWTRRWSGGSKHISNDTLLLSQGYGDIDEWIAHFQYLLQFFNHPKYVRINGSPVFIIYRLGHIGDKLVPMLSCWQTLAREHGFPGLHIVQTVGGWYKADERTEELAAASNIEGSFHFYPNMIQPFDISHRTIASLHDLPLGVSNIQYWGAHVGFDRRPRSPDTTNDLHLLRPDPEQCKQGMRDSFKELSLFSNRNIHTNLYFVNAWNEWNEQAVLEPSDMYGFRYLEGISQNLCNIPMKSIGGQVEKKDMKSSGDEPGADETLPHFVFHIGPSKTGSTAIQHSLQQACVKEIESQGVTLLPQDERRTHHNFVYHLSDEVIENYFESRMERPDKEHFLKNYNATLYKRAWDTIHQCKQEHNQKGRNHRPCVLLHSSEAMSYSNQAVWETLLRRLSGWRVTIVLFHRQAAGALTSTYFENNKRWLSRGIPETFERFANREARELSPASRVNVISRAFEASCGNKGKTGASMCEIVGVSYDYLTTNQQSLFRYLFLNATLRLQGSAHSAAAKKLMGSQKCKKADMKVVRSSPHNAHLHVGFLHKVGSMHVRMNCTSPFDLYADDERVQDMLANVSFPTKCWHVEDPKKAKDWDGEWFKVTGAKVDTKTEVCTLDHKKLNQSHWKIAEELLTPCHA